MIVSHRHRFVFCKTRKTAGTSVEVALSPHCGPDDIITPISEADELLRADLGGRGPQNFIPGYGGYRARDWAVLAVKGRKKKLLNHSSARDVIPVIGRRAWDSYFTFSIERNPWDAVISMYYFRHRDAATRPSLSEFIRSDQIPLLARNWEIYSDGRKVSVDRLCRYETLQQDMDQVWKDLGLPGSSELPRAKSGTRSDRRPYQDLYNERDAAYVAHAFKLPIEELGFQF